MKIIITADLHNGIQEKLNDTIWVMDIISSYAKENKIENILVLGDLFHDRYSINIEVFNKVYTSLKTYHQKGQIWTAFPGNHDMFLRDSWKIISIKSLEGVLNIIDGITNITIAGKRFWIIPFIYYEDNYMKKLVEVEKQYKSGDILLTHIGVKNATLNECFLLKNWSVVDFNNSKFQIVFSGHFHCQQKVGPVHYPGSPIPFRFDEGLVDHGFLVYDTEKNTTEFVKIFDICKKYSDYKAPDFLTVIDKDLLKADLNGNNVKVILSKDYSTDELIKIKTILKEKKGADKISWSKLEKEIKQLESDTEISDSNELFDKWIEHDKPELDKELLLNLHKEIRNTAEEQAISAEDNDA